MRNRAPDSASESSLHKRAKTGYAGPRPRAARRAWLNYLPLPAFIAFRNAVIDINEAAAQCLKAPSPKSLLGKDPLEFVASRNRTRADLRISAALKGSSVARAPELFVTCDGCEIPVSISANAIRHRHSRAILVIFEKHSEQKRNPEIRAQIEELAAKADRSHVNSIFAVLDLCSAFMAAACLSPDFHQLGRTYAERAYATAVSRFNAAGRELPISEQRHLSARIETVEHQLKTRAGLQEPSDQGSSFNSSGIAP